jgi:DNA-binding NtrC family response regulator/tetratricopeptide (TPR) repeat protein
MTTSPSPRRDPAVIAGRYAVRRKLGTGGMGTVYLAHDEASKRLVALKVIRTERLIADAVSRMQDEFRAIASLRHPQIAAAYDFGYTSEARIPFYTREYIQGSPLPPGPPGKEPPGRFLRPILDLLDALAYLHEHGILHLDIHAGNLILADDEKRGSVLIDVGLIHSMDEGRFTVSGGAWPAMPPEMIEKGQVTPRSDLFLAGRILLYRLTGLTAGEPRLPREIPGWGTRLTLDIERIASKALQPSPAHRFASAAELREALLSALGETERRPRLAEPFEATVDRDRELSEIEDVLRGAAAGKCGVLWITGKPGIGKSRLLSEARQRAQLRGLETVAVDFSAGPDAGTSLARALRPARSGRGDADWLEPLRPEHGGSPVERAARAAEALFGSNEGPLVLIVDDVELAGRESRGLLDALILECARRSRKEAHGRGLTIIAASAKAAPRRPAGVRVRPLGPLGASPSRRLFRGLLKPLSPAEAVVRRAAAQAKGSPFLLRRIALALREEWGPRGTIPASADVPRAAAASPAVALDWAKRPPVEREVLQVLAVAGRTASVEEIACAVPGGPGEVANVLQRLSRLEAVKAQGRGRDRRWALSLPASGPRIASLVPSAAARLVHERLATHLRGLAAPKPRDLENLARHLLGAGKRAEALAAAREAAALLRRRGALDRAAAVLEEFAAISSKPEARLDLAEEISSILEEMGDHEKGIAVLEPVYRSLRGSRGPETIRVLRRLGVHLHRAGLAEKALRVFEEAGRSADPARDVRELVLIDSELAELHNFRGSAALAEEAARRGLQRLGAAGASDDAFHGRMEIMLRASLGHIEMRRMSLGRAREELETALRLSRRLGSPRNYRGRSADRAIILHNLAIAENQLNDFEKARRHFREAEQLLVRSGERRNVIKIATNLAVIAAKLGEREEAHAQIERASEMLRRHPGQQLEYFVSYARGIAALLFGEAETAAAALADALPLGRKLGDRFLVTFGQVYLAEAHLLAGRYQEARKVLHDAARAIDEGSPLARRLVHCRLHLIETVLGRSPEASGSLAEIEKTPRTDVVLLEAWNDIAIGFSRILGGAPSGGLLDEALAVFRRLGVPAGARFARLGSLLEAIRLEDHRALRALLDEGVGGTDGAHRFLAVAEPLAAAEAHFLLGEIDLAEKRLAAASGAIVGSPFLELDWRIEFLRARVALRTRDAREARRHLHRSLHIREHLAHLVPAGSRRRFLAHPRFAALDEAASRLVRSPRVEHSTERLRGSLRYEGMIGQSPAMLALFKSIEQLRDQEAPVLIAGETGTGKELVARALHARSHRGEGPFLAVHCASLPPELFESELLGYEAGAFTDAAEGQPGLLEAAGGGTLLLDEVSQLPLECQAKLLRVLDAGPIRRLGSSVQRRLDVRFLSATSADLDAEVKAGRFRADLYWRLRGVELAVPPLRERKEDIPHLSRHFLEKHASRADRPVPALETDALLLLQRHGWLGNVRELETVLLRALISASQADSLGARDLEPLLGAARRPAFPGDLLDRGLEEWKADLEREYLSRLFRRERGDLRAIMAKLGVKRTKLYAWIRALGLDPRELRRGPL